MQTALHILALAEELKCEIIGGIVTSVEFYRKERAVYLFIKKDRRRQAFGFLYHPAGSGAFVVTASKITIDTREKPRPAFSIDGAVVTGVRQVGFDRQLELSLKKDGQPLIVMVEAHGPNGNLWLLDGRGCRLVSLRKRTFTVGDKYLTAPPLDKLSPLTLTAEQLRDCLTADKQPGPSVAAFVRRHVLGFDQHLSHEAVTRSGLTADRQHLGDEQLPALVDSVRQITARFEQPDVGYLYQLPDSTAAYPLRLSSVAQQPEKLKTLSLAVRAMTRTRRTEVQTADMEKRIRDAVSRAARKLQRRLEKVEQDITEAAEYEHYKQMGELLQINFGQIRKGMVKIRLPNVYLSEGTEIDIKLDPSLSPADNVEACFRRYRKGRQGLQLLRRRMTITEEELANLTRMQSELKQDFESARNRYESEIATLMPRTGVKGETAPRLPYREYTLTTGLRIFVGRDGADNDHTTFGHAKPYELWFHAQQCPGSHVVIKFPGKTFQPSKHEIEEAAAVAAWFSKARHDGLVPIIYTQRRYVRKPRKAKPGLVTVEREKSIMVAPQKPER
ncbi:MAG: NFACT RNA binding domain-containing protein [bacterium]